MFQINLTAPEWSVLHILLSDPGRTQLRERVLRHLTNCLSSVLVYKRVDGWQEFTVAVPIQIVKTYGVFQ